jgi:DNA-binding NarL/FixJ family response regulator
MTNRHITLALADDELLFRQGLKAILGRSSHLEILFDASNGKDLIEKLREAKCKPDIVITDLKMPELNGVEATKLILEEFPEIKIIALTSYFSKPFIINMISIGAVAYLAKNSTPKLMLRTIEEVAKKGFYYDDQVMQYIQAELRDQSKHTKSKFDSTFFTKREQEVLQLICEQKTTNEIAEELGISPRTVEGHRNHLLIKTESKNVAGLVIYAIENSLISLDLKQL